MLFIFACEKSEQDTLNNNFDFSVLKLEELQINEFKFKLKTNGYPIGIELNDSVMLTSFRSGTSTNSFSLYIAKTKSSKFHININSNAEVDIETVEIEKHQKYQISITQKNQKESVIYNITFSPIYKPADWFGLPVI